MLKQLSSIFTQAHKILTNQTHYLRACIGSDLEDVERSVAVYV